MAEPSPIGEGGDGEVHVRLKVVPGGSRDAILGLHGDRLRVKVAAPPEGGKANRAVVELLAERLGVPRAALRILAGESNPQKTVAVRGVPIETVRRKLLEEKR